MTSVQPRRRRVVPDAVGVLEPFVAAGVFTGAEVHLAALVARLAPGTADDVLLAVAVAARGPRLGHVCVELDHVPTTVVSVDAGDDQPDLPWPGPGAWRKALGSHPAVVAPPERATDCPVRPLVWDGTRLYLQRYWSYEVSVAEALQSRALPHPVDPEAVASALDTQFGHLSEGEVVDRQRRAAEVALTSRISVIAGGPGTGKTTTVARLLLAATRVADAEGTEPLRIALAAPTGKAAARMTEAVGKAIGHPLDADGDDRVGGDGVGAATAGVGIPAALTLHKLLGAVPGAGFRRNAANPLDADLVVIDETSMVDLSLMAHLLDAVRPDARLVLVGDPHQLASVEAGTVLGDIVVAACEEGSPLAGHLTELTRVHRFAEGSAIAGLADAVRRGAADEAIGLLVGGVPAGGAQLAFDDLNHVASTTAPVDQIVWVRADDVAGIATLERRVADAGKVVVAAARAGDGDAALDAALDVKLLAATRRGPFGLYAWGDRIEAAVADRVGNLRRGERWYVGRPVLLTVNDPILGVANGDVGVVVGRPPDGAVPADGPGGDPVADRSVALRLATHSTDSGAPGMTLRHLPPARLDGVDTWWAMTIHKSQGSEFPEVVVSLPHATSPILTRELLYTAVTRAMHKVTVLASEEALRAAVDRPVARASGLADRLRSERGPS